MRVISPAMMSTLKTDSIMERVFRRGTPEIEVSVSDHHDWDDMVRHSELVVLGDLEDPGI